MLRTFPAWPAPTVEPTSSASVPPPISSGGAPAVQQVAAPPTNSTKGEVWVCTVAVNIRRDPSFRRRPIGSVDEGIAVRIQERRFFASLQWVRLEQPPAPHHEAWVLIKNGAGTRFLRPASASELRSMADAPRLESEVDPITMEPIGDNAFLLRRHDGSQTAYNTDSLIDYILSSNDFTDPVTRIPYSLEDLAALDALAESTNLKRPSVLKAKQNPDMAQQHNDKFRRDALIGLDRCAGETVTSMLRLIEECEDLEEGMLQLATDLFPTFADLFCQMQAADRPFAAQCLRHYIGFVRGPPNRRTRDARGLMRPILHFLQDHQ